MNPDIVFAAWFFASFLAGVGIGSLGVIIPVIATVCTPNRYIAASVAVGTSPRGLGGAVGLVIFMQIFTTKLSSYAPPRLAKAAIANGVPPSSITKLIGAYMTHNPSLHKIPGVTLKVLAALAKLMA